MLGAACWTRSVCVRVPDESAMTRVPPSEAREYVVPEWVNWLPGVSL